MSQIFFEENVSESFWRKSELYLSILKDKGRAFLWKNLRFSLKKISDSFWTKNPNLRWRKSQIFYERKVTYFLWRNRPRFSLEIIDNLWEIWMVECWWMFCVHYIFKIEADHFDILVSFDECHVSMKKVCYI